LTVNEITFNFKLYSILSENLVILSENLVILSENLVILSENWEKSV